MWIFFSCNIQLHRGWHWKVKRWIEPRCGFPQWNRRGAKESKCISGSDYNDWIKNLGWEGKGKRKDWWWKTETCASNQDAITSARLPLLPKRLESQRAVQDSISWKGTQMGVSPTNAQACYLWVEFSGLSITRGNPKSLVVLLRFGDRVQSLGRPKWWKCVAQSIKKRNRTDRELWRYAEESLQASDY